MNRTTEVWRRGRTLLTAIAALGVIVGMTACDDDDDDFTGPTTGVVRAFADSSFNFSALKTFAMPDTVAHFTALSGTPEDPSRAYDQTILNQVRTDLLARGYTGEEVARQLQVSAETVRAHVRNSVTKLHARTRLHAVVLALQRGEISLE